MNNLLWGAPPSHLEIEQLTKLQDADSLFTGKAGKHDQPAALVAWTALAHEGNIAACMRLAVCHYFGDTMVPKDHEKAYAYFQQAAHAGEPDAQASLGWMLEFGEGCQSNPAEALTWTRKAAQQGQPIALNNLGVYFERSGALSEAMAHYKASARAGYVGGSLNAARMHAFGIGVAVDDRFANHYFEQAADAGSALGAYGLAVMISEGRGGSRSTERARELFSFAATRGHAGAQNNLGLMLLDGIGGQQDIIEAAKNFILSKQGGDPNANENLERAKLRLSYSGNREAERRAEAFLPERRVRESGLMTIGEVLGKSTSRDAPHSLRDAAASDRSGAPSTSRTIRDIVIGREGNSQVANGHSTSGPTQQAQLPTYRQPLSYRDAEQEKLYQERNKRSSTEGVQISVRILALCGVIILVPIIGYLVIRALLGPSARNAEDDSARATLPAVVLGDAAPTISDSDAHDATAHYEISGHEKTTIPFREQERHRPRATTPGTSLPDQ
ncbi:MAG: tetratricopeptide repeat protein [Planctomycetota bacterium]|nr:tetratricopeptide repeat protein [Planctomycetota bacterium]